MIMRDLPKCVIIFLMFSPFLFFLFVCPICFVMIWWKWETFCTVEYDGRQRSVIPCRSFCDVKSFLFYFILFFVFLQSLFCFSFLFCYNMMGVRGLLYRRLSWVWETCHTLSLFFWCPVLFCLSFLFCIIWWVWEICHTVEYDGCERPVIPCSSFSYVESLLFFFILCAGLSAFVPSYYLQSRLWIYIWV